MKHLQHLNETEITMWVLMAILLVFTIVAGYIFWLKTAL